MTDDERNNQNHIKDEAAGSPGFGNKSGHLNILKTNTNSQQSSPHIRKENDMEQIAQQRKSLMRMSKSMQQNSMHSPEERKKEEFDFIRKSLNQSPPHRGSTVERDSNIEVQLQEFESIIVSILDLVACKDHISLQSFLETVLLDLTKVYDERGFTLVHIACINCDHKTLDVLIASAFKYWDTQ